MQKKVYFSYHLILITLFLHATIVINNANAEILGSDPILDFSNMGRMTRLKLQFRLSKPLVASDYLKIVFPFPLHARLSATYLGPQGLQRPRQLILTWQPLLLNNTVDPAVQPNPANIFTETVDSATYFVQLLTSQRKIYPMDNNWFQLQFNISDNQAYREQKAGELLQISIYSQSSVSYNAIIYEQNTVFSFLYLDQEPLQKMKLSVVYANITTQKELGIIQDVFFDTSLNLAAEDTEADQLRLVYLLSDNSFRFTGACSSEEKTINPTINALSPLNYSCYIDNTNNFLEIIVNKPAYEKQNDMRFKVSIINPKRIVQNVNAEVRVLRLNSPKILTYGKALDAFSTLQIDVLSQEISLAWGIRPDPALPIPVKVVRGNSPTPQYYPYNSFKIDFQLKKNTPANTELRLNLLINSEVEAQLLQGSVSENLPSIQGKRVVCKEMYPAIQSKRKITCSGVGQLLANTTYVIGFKMFFPFNVYEPIISCTTFGAVYIETAHRVDPWDDVYVVGRERDFMQNIFSYSEYTLLPISISSFLDNLKSFDDTYLLAHATDFQDYAEEVFPSVRPASFLDKALGFSDTFMPLSNLKFLTYLKDFQDLFIAKLSMQDVLKNIQLSYIADSVKYQDDTPLVAISIPKNVIGLQSANSKNWVPGLPGYKQTMVSTQNDVSFVDPATQSDIGIKAAPIIQPQRIVFSLRVPIIDISQQAPGVSMQTGFGFLMLFNPLFVHQAPASGSIFQSSAGSQPTDMTVNINTTVNDTSSYKNSYTFAQIVVNSNNSNLTCCISHLPIPAPAVDMYWALRSFTINDFSSIHSDAKVLDFFFMTVDNFNGPLNLQKNPSYNLINGFSIDSTLFSQINVAFSNLWSGSDTTQGTPVDGNMLPAIIKVQGVISDSTQINRLAIFFDNNIQPLFSNIFGNEISCALAQTSQIQQQNAECLANMQGESSSINNNYFYSLNKFDIKLNGTSTFQYNHDFTLIIPVNINPGASLITIYLAAQGTHAIYQDQAQQNSYSYGQIFGVKSRQTFAITLQSSVFQIPFAIAGLSAIKYGFQTASPQCPNCKVGAEQSTLDLSAGHTDASNVIQANSGVNQGAAFTYVTQWPFIYNASTANVQWTFSDANAQPCLFFNYIFYQNSDVSGHSVAKRYGIYCPVNIGTVTFSTKVILSSVLLPHHTGLNLQAYGAYSKNNGILASLDASYYTIQNQEQILSATIYPNPITLDMKKIVLEWEFVTPVDIDHPFMIKIKSSPASLPITIDGNTQCLLQYTNNLNNDATDDIDLAAQTICSAQQPDQKTLIYTFNTVLGVFKSGNSLSILHYGIDSTSSGAAATTMYDIYLIYTGSSSGGSSSTDVLAATYPQSSLQIDFINNQQQGSKLMLSQFATNTQSKNVLSKISFSFSLQNKQLWPGEQFIFNLGQYAFENIYNVEDLYCTVKDKLLNGNIGGPSHIFESFQFNTLIDATLTVKSYQYGVLNSAFFLECDRFRTPTSPSTRPISAEMKQASSSSNDNDGNTIITAIADLALPQFGLDSPNIYENKVEKKLGTPGSNSEIVFYLKSSRMAITTTSRLIIIFPKYYSSDLSRDSKISCYLDDGVEVYCSKIRDWTIEIKYIYKTISVNKKIQFKVVGITQPLNYQVGQFFVAFDNDYSDISFVEYSFFSDQPGGKDIIGTIDIRNCIVSSQYLREMNVEYTFTMYLNDFAPDISYGQILIINFPSIFYKELKGLDPECSIYREGNTETNYAGLCTINGLSIKFQIKDDMQSGFNYQIIISNLRNPGYYDPSAYKWIIEIANSDQTQVTYRSLESTSSYTTIIFTKNPEQTPLNYYNAQGQLITTLQLTKGIYSSEVYIGRENSEPIYMRSFILSSDTPNIQTWPEQVKINMGTMTQSLRIYSDTAIGEYALFLKKSGDGNYYSNFPALNLWFDDNNLEPFVLKDRIYKVYVQNKEVELLYQLISNPPVTSISIEYFYPDSLVQQADGESVESITGFALKVPLSAPLLTFQQPYNFITLMVSNFTKFEVGSIYNLQYKIQGVNAASYSVAQNTDFITIQVIAQPSDGQNLLSITPISTSNYQNSYEFDVQSTMIGVFYYWVGQSGCSFTEQEIESALKDTNLISASSAFQDCESQLGLINMIQINQDYRLQIKKLKSNKEYTLIAFVKNQLGVNTQTQTITFTTQDNGGQTVKLKIDFAEEITKEQKVKLCCFFSIFFANYPRLVSTIDGSFCSDINYENLLRQRRTLTSVSLLNCSGPSIITNTSNLNQSIYSEKFFFGKNNFINLDSLHHTIIETSNTSCFKDLVQQSVIGIPKIINIYPSQIIPDTPPQLQANEQPIFICGQHWATMVNFKLTESSITYLILEVKGNLNTPSPIQVAKGLNQQGKQALYFKKIYYNSDVQSTYNLTFTPLTDNTDYIIFFVNGNENPFDSITYSQVNNFTFKTKYIQEVVGLIFRFNAIITIFLLICICYF